MAWQKATEYGRRALAETTVGHYKAIIGPKLRARSLSAQQDETAMVIEVLNQMIRIARPMSVRIAYALDTAPLAPCPRIWAQTLSR